MATIITRADKGSSLTHAEMDQNLVNLNRGISDVQTDALLKLQVMPESQILALAAANRDRYAGSGAITSTLFDDFYSPELTANTLPIEDAVYNINGYIINIPARSLLLPPAPAVSTMLERQDLVFLEVWHEAISDKDIVYPNGDVGNELTTDPSTSLTTVAGSFTGYGTYSLFGNWQNAGDLIGKGLVWSGMEPGDKKLFVSDPENNVYLASNGTLVQVRYRIRVIEGGGANWLNASDTTSALYFYYDDLNRIKPKGHLASVASDLGTWQGGFYIGANYGNGTAFLDGNLGAFEANSGAGSTGALTTYGYKGQCFAVPIALVSRRNQGGYHPVFNSDGSKSIWFESGGGADKWFKTNCWDLTSVEDCFNAGNDYTVSYVRVASGAIVNGGGWLNGRPDDKAYDAIYSGDILNLRISARKVIDLKRTLDREFNKLVAGDIRGWESQSFVTSDGTDSGTSSAQSGIAYKELLHCDIIGDPANYPSEWTTNGVSGNALLTGENGENLLPNSASKTFKLSRDANSITLALWSNDNGVTWGDDTSGWGSLLDTTTNSVTKAVPTYQLVMVFYLTEASPFETADNAEVLAYGDVWSGSDSSRSSGAAIIEGLLGKVPESVWSSNSAWQRDYGFSKMISCNITASTGMFGHNYSPRLEHHPAFLTLTNHSTNPAVKVLPYLTRENGKLYLQLLFKELIHNGTSWGDDDSFAVVDGLSTTTDDNGETAIIGQKRIELNCFISEAA